MVNIILFIIDNIQAQSSLSPKVLFTLLYNFVISGETRSTFTNAMSYLCGGNAQIERVTRYQ